MMHIVDNDKWWWVTYLRLTVYLMKPTRIYFEKGNMEDHKKIINNSLGSLTSLAYVMTLILWPDKRWKKLKTQLLTKIPKTSCCTVWWRSKKKLQIPKKMNNKINGTQCVKETKTSSNKNPKNIYCLCAVWWRSN